VKPRIGITSGLAGSHWHPDGTSWWPYAEAVTRAGGEAVHLDARTRGREAAVLAALDGLLFSGGQDIDLSMYPNPPDLGGEDAATWMERHRMKPEPERDAYELPLLEAALDRDLPILGICRGCQVLNVGLGGRLILDIATETQTPVGHGSCPAAGTSGLHSVRIERDTLLAGILAPEAFPECNSRHHQAVKIDEAFTARVSAVSPEDGIIEAIEVPGRRWAVGVQWHPEHPGDPAIRERYEPLFRAFIEAAS
jgi:putative glutamine amidotransferase